MWFMYLLSWLSLIIQICFITLSIAAGLYYLAELVEEYTVAAGKVIKYLIWTVTGIYVGLLLFEDLPFTLVLTGLANNIVYIGLLTTFPFIELSSPIFILAGVMLVVNHYLAFAHFSSVWHPFTEVLAFFTVCLWLVPFSYFVSLSANENVLPTSVATGAPQHEDTDSDIVTNYFKKKTKRLGLLALLKSAQDTLLPQRVKKGY